MYNSSMRNGVSMSNRIKQIFDERHVNVAAFARDNGIKATSLYSIIDGKTRFEKVGISTFLKLAFDVYGKLDQPQIDAFKRLCSTCLVDYEGNEIEPLVIDPKADEMSILGLNDRDIDVLCDAGLAKKLEHYDRMHEVVPGYDTAISTVVTGCMYLAQKRGRTRHGCALFASLPPQVDIASVGSPDRDVTRGTAV